MFCKMMLQKSFAHALMEEVTQLRMENWKNAIAQVKHSVLIVSEADDLAAQKGLLCSPELYREMVHPVPQAAFRAHQELVGEPDLHQLSHLRGCQRVVAAAGR
jgi:hypothetical protein